MVDILPVLSNMFNSIFVLYDRLYTHFGAWTYLIGAFIIYTVYRILLAPIVGGFVSAGRSDMAKKMRSQSQKGRSAYNSMFKEN